MSWFIAIDPGVHSSAAAFYRDGKLHFVTRLFEQEYAHDTVEDFYDLIIELPQVYQGRKQKGDPNDLIDLAVKVGEIKSRWLYTENTVTLVKPRGWKGQVPKNIMGKRILSKLSGPELLTLGDLSSDHNVVDAVGIGLWKLGRL